MTNAVFCLCVMLCCI